MVQHPEAALSHLFIYTYSYKRSLSQGNLHPFGQWDLVLHPFSSHRRSFPVTTMFHYLTYSTIRGQECGETYRKALSLTSISTPQTKYLTEKGFIWREGM